MGDRWDASIVVRLTPTRGSADGPGYAPSAHARAVDRATSAIASARARAAHPCPAQPPPKDARRRFIRAAADAIEGGRAAIVRPDQRAALRGLARRLGLRAFDATLLIAQAQDAARRGMRAGHADGPTGIDSGFGTPHEARRTPDRSRTGHAAPAIAGCLIGLLLAGAAIAWATG